MRYIKSFENLSRITTDVETLQDIFEDFSDKYNLKSIRYNWELISDKSPNTLKSVYVFIQFENIKEKVPEFGDFNGILEMNDLEYEINGKYYYKMIKKKGEVMDHMINHPFFKKIFELCNYTLTNIRSVARPSLCLKFEHLSDTHIKLLSMTS